MRNAVRFVAPLVLVLGLLSWGASKIVDDTNQRWMEKDVRLRAALALSGARRALVRCWRERDPKCTHALLAELTRDERILAAAACDDRFRLLAATEDYPL